MSVPQVTLKNGMKIPILGLGTWKSKVGEVEQAVKDAIDCGYRHIDCAYVYGNENEVGDGIAAKIADGTVKREDLFVTSKLWNAFHQPAVVKAAVQRSLERLKTNYVDLYLIHWPMGYKDSTPGEGEVLFPADDKGIVQFSDVDYVDTWKAMEALVDEGLVKSIGLSNFNSKQIQRVLDIARIKPVMNQFECHPYLNQRKLIDFCRSKDIAVTGYSPLGSPDRPWAKPGDPSLLDDPKLKEIAAKYDKSTAQILIRYQIQRGVIVIPKSVTKSRIISNFDVFGFQLEKDDMDVIDKFDVNGRLIALAHVAHHPHFPFAEEF